MSVPEKFAPLRIASHWLFGSAHFSEADEYQQFRYKFLILLMVSGALLTVLAIVGALSGINPIGGAHNVSMVFFTASSTGLWVWLRGRPQHYLAAAWLFECVCLWEYTSALVYVPFDELRVLWFYSNIPGVFILLGQAPGWVITLGTVCGLVVGNAWLNTPYSGNAMVTAVLAMGFMGVFFHAYVDRSMSYFLRMRDYNAQLKQLASHDSLTGVMNARAYYAACDQQIRSSVRGAQPYAVLFVDLDHFKRINDTHGHAAGDTVLRVVANTLTRGIRRSDLLGRIGGEAFSVFLPNTGAAGAMALAENLRAAVEACRPGVREPSLVVTASIGVAVSQNAHAAMHAIQEKADAAMYEAKQAGRNRVSMLVPQA